MGVWELMWVEVYGVWQADEYAGGVAYQNSESNETEPDLL